MKYRIKGDSDFPLVEIDLASNETIKIERGSMAYMQDVDIKGKMNSGAGGGLLSAIGRSLTSGESMFITEATGKSNEAVLGIAPSTPGRVVAIQVEGANQYRLNTDAFLACDLGVNYVMRKQKVSAAFFGGTGGFFVMETQGTGDVLVSAFGDIIELEVTPDKSVIIDNEHVVAWDASLNYDIRIASGTFGFKTGEGLVNEFTGRGKVFIQTRTLHSFADKISRFIPTN